MLADRGMRLEEARDMIQRALDQEPVQRRISRQPGVDLLQAEQDRGCRGALRKAGSARPHDPTIRTHLRRRLRQQGRLICRGMEKSLERE